MYKIVFLDKAEKKLKSLDKNVAKFIISKIYLLESGISNNNIKKLTNYEMKYRYRIGKWRILFNINENIIKIQDIRLRKEGY